MGEGTVTLKGRRHVAGEELRVDATLTQTWQVDVPLVRTVAEPAVVFELVANAVAVAVDHKGVKMKGEKRVGHGRKPAF